MQPPVAEFKEVNVTRLTDRKSYIRGEDYSRESFEVNDA
jgi:hypothetical protein